MAVGFASLSAPKALWSANPVTIKFSGSSGTASSGSVGEVVKCAPKVENVVFHTTVSDPTKIAGWSLMATPLSLSRTYISFMASRLGQTSGPLCFTITNTSNGLLFIYNISIMNCSSSVDPQYIDCARVAGFQIVSGGGLGTLATGASRDVCITFTPGEAATFSAFVLISTNASTTPAQVELHGTGDRCPSPQVRTTVRKLILCIPQSSRNPARRTRPYECGWRSETIFNASSNRAWRTFVDMLVVRWMRSRRIAPPPSASP